MLDSFQVLKDRFFDCMFDGEDEQLIYVSSADEYY